MLEFLTDYAASRPVSFHMPGHKGAALFERYGYGDFLQHLCDCDITEIPGADNLFRPEGIIRDVQKRYADLYDVDRSYLMVNGTSGGLMAAVMAAVPPGGRLIMARNCHKSIYNGLILGGIQPVYVYPEIEASWGICGPVDPGEIQRALQQYPDAAAVVLPSPNYYGLCSDIAAIAGIVHDAGKILIVDQAHGAHLHFFHKYVPGCEKATLMGTGSTMGIRESRHVHGDFVLPVDDLIAGVVPDDVILLSANSIDVHGAMGGPAGGLYMPIKKDLYGIPYRVLLPAGVDSLLLAGRCISADSAAAGAIRVMPPAMALGQAAGEAAALSLKAGIQPRQLDYSDLRTALLAGKVCLS